MTVDLCMAYTCYAHARFDDLELDFENVCKACPTCFFSLFLRDGGWGGGGG